MKERSLDYREMFDIAKEFLEVAEQAESGKDAEIFGWSRRYIIPEIVNRAFSCEVFLKSLLVYSDPEIKRKHKLYDLWKLLDNDIKSDIQEDLFGRISFDNEEDFDKYLKRISDAFVEWRYIYETNAKSIPIGYLKAFNHSLREICCKKYHNCSWEQYKEML